MTQATTTLTRAARPVGRPPATALEAVFYVPRTRLVRGFAFGERFMSKQLRELQARKAALVKEARGLVIPPEISGG